MLLSFCFYCWSCCSQQQGAISIAQPTYFSGQIEQSGENFLNHMPDISFRSSTFDYFITNRLSIGGAFQYQSASYIDRNVLQEFKRLDINPHIKFGQYWQNVGIFTSASVLFREDSGTALPNKRKDVSTFIGVGFLAQVFPNLGVNGWYRIPLTTEFNSTLRRDFSFSLGLQLFFNKEKVRVSDGPLWDYYFNKHNLRIYLNYLNIGSFSEPKRLLNSFEFTFRNSILDFLDFYLEYKKVDNENARRVGGDYNGRRIAFGLITTLKIDQQFFVGITTGIVNHNTDANFEYEFSNSTGLDIRLQLQYFFKRNGIIRTGVNWQATGLRFPITEKFQMHPFIGFEVFGSKRFSLEPRLAYQITRFQMERFQPNEIIEYEDRGWAFQMIIRTLISRKRGIFTKRENPK